MKPLQDKYIKEFHDKFVGEAPDYHDELHQNHKTTYSEKMLVIKDLEDWLSATLLAVEEEYKSTLLEKVKGMKVEHLDNSDQTNWGEPYTTNEALRTRAFNQALDQIESIIGEI